MHYKIENEMNSNANHPTSTSCTSSTDSGVIIIDKKIKSNSNNNNNHNTSRTINDNVNEEIKRENDTAAAGDEKINNKINYTNKSDKSNETNNINIENTINISDATTHRQDRNNMRWQYPTTTFQQNIDNNFRPASKNNSPTLSIRSTTISIVSIDENAIDSSVVDSDSDDADAEGGAHSNYIVKKLGQQTTYPPDSADLPNINKGLTVISQKITPNGTAGSENALLNGGLNSPPLGAITPSTPQQIGSIALSNTTDVTFGDKHFYEGPVTIQQFLIDSREKWKPTDEDGQDNPIFTHESARECEQDVALKENSPPEQPYKFIFNRKAICITTTIILLTILIGILIVVAGTFFKSTIRKNIDDDDNNYNGTLCIMDRDQWSARPAKGVLVKLQLPVHRVIISHTATDICETKEVCAFRMQVTQAFHMDSWGWDDIGYNFLIGGDGCVYVGRGWDNQGAHTKGYNKDSVGISFIGTYSSIKPNEKQLNATALLIEEGVRLNKLSPDYGLYGHRQLSATESPGDALYEIIRAWPHWSAKI